MSTINHSVIATRLTTDRLRSYLSATSRDLERAIDLYDWNARMGGALHEDIGRLEVVFRNAIDGALLRHGHERNWRTPWYRRADLFPGKHGSRMLDTVAEARARARRGASREIHGKVIAELTFGFWRYLCLGNYTTSLWVPALTGVFPGHPAAGDTRVVRRDVEDRMQRLHFLRNRIAHYEPIHRRNLQRDHDNLTELVGWICRESRTWIAGVSRTCAVLAERPSMYGLSS